MEVDQSNPDVTRARVKRIAAPCPRSIQGLKHPMTLRARVEKKSFISAFLVVSGRKRRSTRRRLWR